MFYWRKTFPSPTVAVLADEFAQLHRKPARHYSAYAPRIQAAIASGADLSPKLLAEAEKQLILDCHESEQNAICLSGGGIRSAAFALGAIQQLAEHRIENFKYLSTVSGGGYIGAWLSTWIAKETGGWPAVKARINWDKKTCSEAAEVRHVRENSRYLTQKSGLGSGDTWAPIAIWVRNLILNWSLFLPLFCALVLLPRLFMAAVAAADIEKMHVDLFEVVGCGCYLLALFTMAFNRPRWTRINLARERYGPLYFWPLTIAAFYWAASVAKSCSTSTLALAYGSALASVYGAIWIAAIVNWRWGPGRPLVFVRAKANVQSRPGKLDYVVALSRMPSKPVSLSIDVEDRQAVKTIHFDSRQAQKVSFGPGMPLEQPVTVVLKNQGGPSPFSINGSPIGPKDVRLLVRQTAGEPGYGRVIVAKGPWKREAAWEIVCAVLRGGTVGLLLALCQQVLAPVSGSLFSVPAVLAGPAAALLAHMAGAIVFIAFHNMTPKSESDREWHGRADGLTLSVALAWLLWTAVSLLLPFYLFSYSKLLDFEHAKALGAGASAVAGFLGGIVAWFGKGASSPATKDSKARGWRQRLPLPLAGVLFIVLLTVAVSIFTDRIIGDETFVQLFLSKCTDGTFTTCAAKTFTTCLSLFCVAVGLPAFLGFFINVNRFSMHAIYRNRLVRAFIGASRDHSRPVPTDAFTGFRDSDNIEMQRLWERRDPSDPESGWRPFHVVNMAMNVVSSTDLALKDRKALPFVATPLWCGAAGLAGGRGAFRRSSEFGGEQKTITIGTATAISGAAVSPNMGYHSSPLISFLLALFNVRLGWWFGNPLNDDTYRLEGPRWALKPLIYEALGLTNATRPYVYLSDGGHFDNLGLYEMVRRRCRCILVIDAGGDPDCDFQDLSNSAARILSDFGVPLEINLSDVRKRNPDRFRPNDGGRGYAVGRIRYKKVDGEGSRDGVLIYVKPSFRGDEPVSILGYASKSEDFPHESTLNQWFSDTQFESYRTLGYHMLKSVRRRSRALRSLTS